MRRDDSTQVTPESGRFEEEFSGIREEADEARGIMWLELKLNPIKLLDFEKRAAAQENVSAAYPEGT
jgi:hypothetical protein